VIALREAFQFRPVIQHLAADVARMNLAYFRVFVKAADADAELVRRFRARIKKAASGPRPFGGKRGNRGSRYSSHDGDGSCFSLLIFLAFQRILRK
jgi:hypothetical protein